jgi:hypothetical protein
MYPVYDIEFLAVEIKVDFDQVKYDTKNHYTHPKQKFAQTKLKMDDVRILVDREVMNEVKMHINWP